MGGLRLVFFWRGSMDTRLTSKIAGVQFSSNPGNEFHADMPRHEPKTRETDASVEDFLNSVENKERREDGFRLLKVFSRITGEEPKMWGPAIIGFSKVMLRYLDGSELDWPAVAFSPRKQNLTLYVMTGTEKQKKLFEKLGKHSTSLSCLYIKRLSDVDVTVLEKIVADAHWHRMKHVRSVQRRGRG